MTTELINQKIKDLLTTKKDHSKEIFDLFSFLTDFNSKSINSKTKNLNNSFELVSRITTKGKIKFCNTDFCKATNETSKKLQNKKITSIFHPEMPKTILNKVKNELTQNTFSLAVIKGIDKDGNSIWLNTHFSANTSNKLNIACNLKAKPSSKETINKIEAIYNTIFLLENHVSQDIATKYFDGLLEMEYGNYEGFLINAFQ